MERKKSNEDEDERVVSERLKRVWKVCKRLSEDVGEDRSP